MTQATKADVEAALDFLVQEWREDEKLVLTEIEFPKIKYDADLFKAIGWLNFATDYTGTLIPDSAVHRLATQAINGLNIPLWIMGKAQSEFAKYHEELTADHQKLLNAKFTSVRDRFFDKIDAMAATLIDSSYGRGIVQTVLEYLKDRQFKDEAQKKAFLRQLIRYSRLIETSSTVLRNTTHPPFLQLMRKIKLLWMASHHAPIHSRSKMWFRGNRGNPYSHVGTLRNKDDQKLIDRIIATAWGFEAYNPPGTDNVMVTPLPGGGLHAAPTIFNPRSFKGEAIDLHWAEQQLYHGKEVGVLTPWELRKEKPVPVGADD